VKSESSEHKGKLIMEEKKLSGKTILLLVVLVSLIYGALMFWVFCPGGCLLFLLMLIMVLPYILISPLGRRYPIIIYENGFDAPLEVYKVLKGEKRFVPFGDIKKIRPYYGLSSQDIIGYVVITTDGREIKMLDIMNWGKTYEEGLKKGLGKRWERLYSPEPYGLLDNLDEEKMRKCLSKKREWVTIVGYIPLLFMIPVLLLLPFMDRFFILFAVLLSVAFIGSGFGMLVIMERRDCKKKYDLIARFRPDIAKRLKHSGGTLNSVDMARNFDKKDWKRIQRLFLVNPFLLMGIGILLIIIGISVEFTDSIAFYLFVAGMALISIAIVIVLMIESKEAFLKSIIEEEHRTGERIIPDYFVIPKWMEFWMPYRDAPDLTEKDWKRIVKNAAPIGEKEFVLITVILTSSVILAFLLFMLLLNLGFPTIFGIGVLFVLTFLPLIWFKLRRAHYFNMARKLLAYEEETGEKVIPEKYRKRIESSLMDAYRR